MKEFMKPQIEIICFTADVVYTSGDFPENNTVEGIDPGWDA